MKVDRGRIMGDHLRERLTEYVKFCQFSCGESLLSCQTLFQVRTLQYPSFFYKFVIINIPINTYYFKNPVPCTIEYKSPKLNRINRSQLILDFLLI